MQIGLQFTKVAQLTEAGVGIELGRSHFPVCAQLVAEPSGKWFHGCQCAESMPVSSDLVIPLKKGKTIIVIKMIGNCSL